MNNGVITKRRKNRRGGKAVKERIARAKANNQARLNSVNNSESQSRFNPIIENVFSYSNDEDTINYQPPQSTYGAPPQGTYSSPPQGDSYPEFPLDQEDFAEYFINHDPNKLLPELLKVQRVVHYQGQEQIIDTVKTIYSREVLAPTCTDPSRPSTPKIVEFIELD